jgi:hypothetical protein
MRHGAMPRGALAVYAVKAPFPMLPVAELCAAPELYPRPYGAAGALDAIQLSVAVLDDRWAGAPRASIDTDSVVRRPV